LRITPEIGSPKKGKKCQKKVGKKSWKRVPKFNGKNTPEK